MPRLHEEELFEEDRENVAKEISEADTLFAVYRSKDGRNRVLTTGYCFELFTLMIVVLSRHIEVFAFFKKLIETIETIRKEEDISKHVLEAVTYIKLYTNQKKLNNL